MSALSMTSTSPDALPPLIIDSNDDPLPKPPLTPVPRGNTFASSVNYFYRTIVNKVHAEATFFRCHLLAFTFIPFIASGIFYACNSSNEKFKVGWLDSAFLCYSAMTVTGLSTVNLSTVTPGQQVILFVLMLIVSRLLLCTSPRLTT